ncbi:MAG TPA: hypothetical protein VF507_01210, partial [Pyrinomonadaceae bacterium]
MKSLPLLLRRVYAFVVRDFQVTISYYFELYLRVTSILIMTVILFFISRIFVGIKDIPYSQWQDPLAAWLTGLAVLSYFMTGFSSLANAIRQEQMQGTLESVLLTPIGVPTIITASSAWEFIQQTFFSFLYLFFGWFFFGVRFQGSYLLA